MSSSLGAHVSNFLCPHLTLPPLFLISPSLSLPYLSSPTGEERAPGRSSPVWRDPRPDPAPFRPPPSGYPRCLSCCGQILGPKFSISSWFLAGSGTFLLVSPPYPYWIFFSLSIFSANHCLWTSESRNPRSIKQWGLQNQWDVHTSDSNWRTAERIWDEWPSHNATSSANGKNPKVIFRLMLQIFIGFSPLCFQTQSTTSAKKLLPLSSWPSNHRRWVNRFRTQRILQKCSRQHAHAQLVPKARPLSLRKWKFLLRFVSSVVSFMSVCVYDSIRTQFFQIKHVVG